MSLGYKALNKHFCYMNVMFCHLAERYVMLTASKVKMSADTVFDTS